MANMEFWGTEVKAGEPFKVQPGEGMMLHLSQASLGEVKKDKGNETVLLYVNVDGKKIVLGTLSTEKCTQISYDLVFEKEFELSHSWKNGSVYFVGYKAAMGFEESDDDALGFSDYSEDDEAPPLVAAAANGKPEPKDEKPKASADKGKAVKPETSVAKPNAKPVKDDKPKVSDDEDDDSDDEDDDDDDLLDDDSDDEDMLEGEGDSAEDEDESSDEEDEPTPKDVKASKKRPAESSTKTPIPEKKAKLVTPQKSGGEGKKGSSHTATPHPSKQAGKSNADKSKLQTPKSGGSHACKSCTKTFNSDGALQSHTKAKHQ